jgi:hypothetical protein
MWLRTVTHMCLMPAKLVSAVQTVVLPLYMAVYSVICTCSITQRRWTIFRLCFVVHFPLLFAPLYISCLPSFFHVCCLSWLTFVYRRTQPCLILIPRFIPPWIPPHDYAPFLKNRCSAPNSQLSYRRHLRKIIFMLYKWTVNGPFLRSG